MQPPISKKWLVDNNKKLISDKTPLTIMQFGEGNFLRAFVDWIFKTLNDDGLYSGAVRVVQPIPRGQVEQLKKQDYVYSLVLRGMEDGEVRDEAGFVDVIRDGVNPYEEWRRFLECARAPELRYVVSNTTEAGIVYVKTDYPETSCPESFPAKVAAMLAARHKAVGGARGSGLVFLPCELIEKNGDNLRAAILRHLEDWMLADTVGKWVEESCLFHNTLVDRIVTGFPGAEAESLWARLGCSDHLLDVGEYFHLWVIEGDARLDQEIPFSKSGLNVVITDNLQPYRDRKVRVLNGAHTGNVLAAYLAGMDTVGEMMDDPLLGAFLRAMVLDEILPGVALPEEDKRGYAEAVFERFMNPFVRHELLSISLNSVSKWKVRVLPSLKDYVAATKTTPKKMAFSLAALIAFYRGSWNGGEYSGERNGKAYPIRDDRHVLDAMSTAWSAHGGDMPALAAEVLGNAELWGEDLNVIPGLGAAVGEYLGGITATGVREAIGKCR